MESTFQKVCLNEIESVLGSLGHTPEAGHSVGEKKWGKVLLNKTIMGKLFRACWGALATRQRLEILWGGKKLGKI